jgi:hypothetical protein
MATWTGKPKKFSMEVFGPENYGYGEWEEVEYNWEYGTVSDYFRINTTMPGKEKEYGDLLSKEGAIATLHCLMEWYNSYEGSNELDEMVKEIRKGRE